VTWTCLEDDCPIHDLPQPNPPGKAEAWFYRHWRREHQQKEAVDGS
jgi:hypothetical protein